MTEPVLSARAVSKTYRGGVRALDRVDLTLARGECLGLVGESGSGKSTLARLLLGLDGCDDGTITVDGREVTTRGRPDPDVQMVFQHPAAAFNSRLRLLDSVAEPLRCRRDRARRILEPGGWSERGYLEHLLDLVELPASFLDRRPHQVSGGELQRLAIARALAARPSVLVLDEPTSSLDVPVQAVVLDLLSALRRDLGLSYLFISHDLAAVHLMSERMTVLRDGVVVDTFDAADIYSPARHAYTAELVALFTDSAPCVA